MGYLKDETTIIREGQKINNIYEVERFLGEGAFANVYRVRHRFLGRQAMKVFKRMNLSQEETEEILSEAILLSKLGHPNIIRVYNADTFESAIGIFGFFTMEYVAGGTLEQFWKSFIQNFIPISQTVEVMIQICQGLSVAHSYQPPIIHRDIKPQNILVGYDASGINIKISDFGLAKQVNPLTLMASAKGTLAFKAPESFEDNDSTRTDVFAVGSVMYLLLTDQLPFQIEEGEDFAYRKRFNRALIPPSRHNIDVDKHLEAIVIKALSIEPEKRYKDAIEMLLALKEWQKGRAITKYKDKHYALTEKTALSGSPPISLSKANEMIKAAFELALLPGQLKEAADLLEEAINAAPELRTKYSYQLQLWRKGVIM